MLAINKENNSVHTPAGSACGSIRRLFEPSQSASGPLNIALTAAVPTHTEPNRPEALVE